MQRNLNLKLLSVLSVALSQLLLFASCTPSLSPVEQTATALVNANATQYAAATQLSLFMTGQPSISGQQPFIIVAPVGTALPALPPPATLQALTAQPCIFQWVTQDLPEVTRSAQSAFARVPVLADVSVQAQAYGENCLEPDGTVRYFAAMTTDFYLAAEVESLGDLDSVATLVLAALDTLSSPLNVTLPAKLGYLDLMLTTGDTRGNLRTAFDQIVFAHLQEFTGGALIDALGGVVQR